jgi:hypothetical protein
VKILSVIRRLYVHCSTVRLRVLSIVIPPDHLSNRSRYKIQNPLITDALLGNTSHLVSEVGQIWTLENYGLRKELAIIRISTTCWAKVAWLNRVIARKECTRDNLASRTQRGRMSRMRPRKGLGCNNGIRNRGQKPTTWQQEDRGPSRQTAATFWKNEGNQRDLL